MLSFDIKRKINTLRDILVGKVPDPKAQVEQITIALIYKFMDDMDLSGLEFGGERVFFAGDYQKYAFSQIMLSENSAQERLNLYAEGIDKMTNNPELPQLFRDILRNTYIPYRDPETLNRFLKEIADFSYDDSEDLGNAFEYLLSIMGSQGDAGQFRTPRHIIDMMVEIIEPQKNESILDPACGTAGFLISAYNYIKNHNVDEYGNSTLTADDRNRINANFAGYDISPDMVRLSRVNMYLHRFSNPNISEYDTLTSLDKWEDKYDVIFANPPFMTPKGGIVPHSRYQVSAKRAEVLFVDYIAEHLLENGRAAVIVPEGIVFQSQTAYKQLRDMLIKEYLYAVISLPAGVFNPYSGVKTSILIMDKLRAKEQDSILFVKLNNDGYDLGAQRREIKGSEIPDVLNIFRDYKAGKDVSDRPNVVVAKKEDIKKQDYILVGERYRKEERIFTKWDNVKISECCELRTGGTPSKQNESYWNNGNIKWISSKHITDDGKISGYNYITQEAIDNSSTKIAPKGSTILVTRVSVGKSAYATDDYAINQDMTCLIPNDSLDNKYLFLISSILAQKIERDAQGIGVRGVSQKYVSELTIPLPPLTVQQEIVDEIESYQRIIDGARQVVDNYKPTVKVEEGWEHLKLKEVCSSVHNGANVMQIDDEGKYRVTRIQTISDGVVNLQKTKWTNDEPSEEYFMQAGDILLSHINSFDHLAKTAIFPDVNEKVVHGINLIRLRVNQNIILPDFAILVLKSDSFILEARKYAQRAVNQASIKVMDIVNISIPVPPIEVQKDIIKNVKEEMSIVEQNKRLIEIFQQKIADKIAEVWGE